MEKEEDLKRLKYNMEKAKKEEEEIAEKKRLQAQRERETQKMREKQEKFADKQALLDELRAKRAYEEAERKADLVTQLIQARQEKNLTQRDLESMTGIKQPVIARLESGKVSTQIGTLLRVLSALGKTLKIVDAKKPA